MIIFLKIICVTGGFGVCAFGGYRYSQKYVLRERYFAETVQLCVGINADISFVRLSLIGILQKYGGSFKSFLSVQLGATAALLNDNKPIEEETLYEYIPKGFLSGEEYETLIRFFNILGKSDAENQAASIESFKAVFQKYHNDAIGQKKKYASLYWKLGLLAGAVIAVFVI